MLLEKVLEVMNNTECVLGSFIWVLRKSDHAFLRLGIRCLLLYRQVLPRADPDAFIESATAFLTSQAIMPGPVEPGPP